MAPPNPYASPRASLDIPDSPEGAPEPSTWRLEGDRLVVRKNAVLPPICLHSGETIEGQRVRAELSWSPSWFIALVIVAPLIAALVYSSIRRGGSLDHALGAAGRRRRRNALLIGLAVMVALVGLFGWMIGDLSSGLIAIPIAIFPIVFIAGPAGRSFKVLHIDRYHIRLRLRPAVAAAFSRLPA